VQSITLRQLETIMRECAGEDEAAQPLEQTPEQPFQELGYDSLALLETHSRIKRDFNVELHEEDLENAKTPRELVDLVNARLKAA
jgi:act minimal PKS acyl carrier protein